MQALLSEPLPRSRKRNVRGDYVELETYPEACDIGFRV